MQHPIRLSLAIALLAASHAQADNRFETRSSLHSISYSDIAPIKQVIDGLKGKPINAGDFAFTHNQFEISQHWNNWEFAAFWRYDYYLEFDKDTAQLIYLDKNRQPYQEGKVYKVELDANHLRSQGLGIGYVFNIRPGLDLRTRANYLSATEMQDGSLRGAVATEAGNYSGQLDLDYNYSEDKLLKRAKQSVKGRGWSLDLDLDWQINSQLNAWLHGRDLYSAIRWNNLTYTVADATTDRASYNPDGTISFRPAVSGFEGYRDHTQRLPARYTLGSSYRMAPEWSLTGEIFSYDEHLFPRAALNWHLKHATLQASYDFGADAFGLGVNSKYLQVLLRADDTDYQKAKALQLHIAGQIRY
ncbi:hypothetical protein [Halopseudomonas yangmingensis]|uniref:Uncharacterized protein n=1 Tax=Halopseudomonas yangmingensis TaxID=1720063 RepID=A0A1I4RXE7_9GAMM|nr:hypothetical protein [Halopseudomonas yangmingensis]SFM56942.1 hypothetical protein SAMN05216217_10842 [Halopseudomonas yangmingensis]